ncbi:MAG TPA: TIGR03067 domain-containing protein [Gemmataceae bacterium]|nr:TIGR03067 domain-containing protein [Gemmataceae bacterium]
MRALLSLSLFALALGVSSADDKKDPTAGKWVVESVTRDGKADDQLKGWTRTHANGKYALKAGGGVKNEPIEGTYTVDDSKTPVTIDMKPTDGRYKDKTLMGIAKVDGDTLTVAFAEPGKDRPTSFESKAGSGVVVAVHKRAK